MIISILTIIFIISLHVFPKRIREKILYRLKRIIAKIRRVIRRQSI